MAKVALDWKSVDTADMPDNLKAGYATLLEAKAEFERLFTESFKAVGAVPADAGIAFSYKHGSLGIAVTKAKNTANVIKFSELGK